MFTQCVSYDTNDMVIQGVSYNTNNMFTQCVIQH